MQLTARMVSLNVSARNQPNKSLQLTSNTPLRSVLRSTELKRYVI
jgi:hypothetical protein